MHRSTLCSFAAAVSAAAFPPRCPAARQVDAAFPACQGGLHQPLQPIGEFVANAGQWNPAARFLLQQGNVRTWVIDDGFVVDAAGGDRGVAVRFLFAGAEGHLCGQLPSASRRHWLRGESRITDVAAFGRVRCSGLYPGVDCVLRSEAGHGEYDLVLAGSADLRAIRVRVEGAERLRLLPDGGMAIDTALGELRQTPPRTFSARRDGALDPLPCRCVLLGTDEFGFAVDGWDGGELTIDPGLLWGTFLGGTGADVCTAVAIDSQNRTIVAGTTTSTDLPTTPGSYRTTAVAQTDAFVAALTNNGQTLAWCTYLGGNGIETVGSLEVLTGDKPVIGGTTTSTNFPVGATAFQSTNGGGIDGYATILTSDGAHLDYSTYYGGVGDQTQVRVTLLPSNGDLVFAGRTTGTVPTSTTSPVVQGARNGLADVFLGVVTRLQTGPAALRYGTYFGGSNNEEDVSSLSMDSSGVATIGFSTSSTDMVTTVPYPSANPGPLCGFLLRIDPAAPTPQTQLVFANYFGQATGTTDRVMALTDSTGYLTIVARTSATNWPTSLIASQRFYGGGQSDVIVCRYDPNAATLATAIMLMTYMGGSGDETPHAFSFNYNPGVTEQVAVVGSTTSTNFPVTAAAMQRTMAGSGASGFLGIVDMRVPGPAQFVYGTFVDGVAGGDDSVEAIARSPGNLFTLAGSTNSVAAPGTPGTVSTFPRGGTEGLVLSLDIQPMPAGFRTYGTGCGTPGFVPAITGGNVPRMGQQFACNVVNLHPNAVGLMFMGVSDSSWFGLPLPFELSGYGLPGCFQLNSADVSFLLLASGTNMSFGFLTPASMSYYGFDLFLQCGVIDPAANALGLAVSNGAALDVRF